MQTILTNKAITVTVISSDLFELRDALGNIEKINKKFDAGSLKSEFGINACFIKELYSKPIHGINDQFSLILTHSPLISMREKIHSLLSTLRQIEDLAFHLVSNHIIDDEVLSIFRQDNELRIQIKEGRVDSASYEKIINQLTKKNKGISSGLLVKTEIARIGDLIRTELCHSEFSILQSVNFLGKLIVEENSRHKFAKKTERFCYGYLADASTWSFMDSIKAMSTALDMLAKLVKLIMDTKFNEIPKTKSLTFGNLSCHKSWNRFCSKNTMSNLQRILEELKLVIRLRHDLTHNSGLYPLQNFTFVGLGTPSVEGLVLAYADLPLWDHDGNTFYSAQKQLGFFSQHNNAIEFAINSIVSTSVLVEEIFKILRFELIDKCKSQGINRFNSLEWRSTGVIVNHYTLNELEKLVVH